MKYQLRHIVEYGLLRALVKAVNLLPYSGALCLGWLCAGVSFALIGARRREAARRVRTVFGDALPSKQVRRIIWLSWRNLLFTVVETARSGNMTRDWVRSVSDFDEANQRIRDYLGGGKGAILVGPHMGSWELAGVASHLCGVPIFSIAGRQRNPLVNTYLNLVREKAGIRIFVRGSSLMRTILRELRAGNVFAILTDVRMPTREMDVSFLGKTANVGGGMAAFAYHANVPIFPCITTRIGWNRHTFQVYDPIVPNPQNEKDQECRRLTQDVFNVLEKAIRDKPEQWFWYNKRWILEPLAVDAAAEADGAT